MLFILTGDIQTGKTRWLEALIDELNQQGVVTDGVVAPGVWRKRTPAEIAEMKKSEQSDGSNEHSDSPANRQVIHRKLAGIGEYEKLGIDNRLLPEGTLVHFARRYDLAQQEDSYDSTSQSAQARLGWAIDEDALSQVNDHFKMLTEEKVIDPEHPHFLVVDEFGRLELMRNEGLTNARSLIEEGATQRYPHALIVVRKQLADLAYECFAHFWDDICVITPNDESRHKILSALIS